MICAFASYQIHDVIGHRHVGNISFFKKQLFKMSRVVGKGFFELSASLFFNAHVRHLSKATCRSLAEIYSWLTAYVIQQHMFAMTVRIRRLA